MKSADLSVIVPNYNHAHYLPRSLDAILRQSVLPREVVVVDDASTDDSVHVVERIAARNPLVRLVRNEHNLGVNATILRGVAQSSGRYLCPAAADDFLLPGFIRKSMELLALHPEAGLSCVYYAAIDGMTGKVHHHPCGWFERPAFLPPREVVDLVATGCFPCRGTIYKRSAFDRAGGFLPDLRWHSDWFTMLVVAFRDGVCHIPERLQLWTALPTTYSEQGARSGGPQREVLAALLARLTSADFADVAPYFRETGVLTGWFGPEMWQAAATRPDRWEPSVLGLISRFSPEQYEPLLRDDDPEVRALAAFFLGPLWREGESRRERLEAQLARANRVITDMKNNRFWKVREACVRLRRALAALAGRRAAA